MCVGALKSGEIRTVPGELLDPLLPAAGRLVGGTLDVLAAAMAATNAVERDRGSSRTREARVMRCGHLRVVKAEFGSNIQHGLNSNPVHFWMSGGVSGSNQ